MAQPSPQPRYFNIVAQVEREFYGCTWLDWRSWRGTSIQVGSGECLRWLPVSTLQNIVEEKRGQYIRCGRLLLAVGFSWSFCGRKYGIRYFSTGYREFCSTGWSKNVGHGPPCQAVSRTTSLWISICLTVGGNCTDLVRAAPYRFRSTQGQCYLVKGETPYWFGQKWYRELIVGIAGWFSWCYGGIDWCGVRL